TQRRPRVRSLRPCGLAFAAANRRRGRRATRADDARSSRTAVAIPRRSRGRERRHSDRLGRRGQRLSMQEFARLFASLDQTTSTNAKVVAMAAYFTAAPAGDAAW